MECDVCKKEVERRPVTFPDGASGWAYSERVLITGIGRVTHERCFLPTDTSDEWPEVVEEAPHG